MTHKEFYFWLQGFTHDKKISSYDEASTLLLTIKEKMNEVEDNDPFFSDPRTVIPQLQPIKIPTQGNPYEITCKNENFRND